MKLLSLIIAGLMLTTQAWADDIDSDREVEILKTAITYMVVHSDGHYGDTSMDNIESWLNNANILTYRQAKNKYVEFNANKNIMYVEIETDDSVYDVAIVSMRKDGSVATSMMFVDYGERTKADIIPANKGKVLGLLTSKTAEIYRALWGEADYKDLDIRCMIENYIKGTVECVITDIDEGHGWTVGVAARWDIHRHPNDYLAIYPLELNILEH